MDPSWHGLSYLLLRPHLCRAHALYLLQDTFAELQIPCTVINASRKVPVVEFSMKKALKQFTTDRAGLLRKCTPIDLAMAKKLLDHGYKQTSKFKKWCPIEVCMYVCMYVCMLTWIM